MRAQKQRRNLDFRFLYACIHNAKKQEKLENACILFSCYIPELFRVGGRGGGWVLSKANSFAKSIDKMFGVSSPKSHTSLDSYVSKYMQGIYFCLFIALASFSSPA